MDHSASATDLPTVSRLPDRPDLPDPLVTYAGDQVESAEAWHDRRPELKRLFEHYVYGVTPGRVPVEAECRRTTSAH